MSPSESVRSGTEMQGRLNRRESGGSLPLEYLKATEENTDSEQVRYTGPTVISETEIMIHSVCNSIFFTFSFRAPPKRVKWHLVSFNFFLKPR